jgi:hypothetical protein
MQSDYQTLNESEFRSQLLDYAEFSQIELWAMDLQGAKIFESRMR